MGVSKANMMPSIATCHSEEQSDEESLLALRITPDWAKPRPFATAHIVPMSFGRVIYHQFKLEVAKRMGNKSFYHGEHRVHGDNKKETLCVLRGLCGEVFPDSRN